MTIRRRWCWDWWAATAVRAPLLWLTVWKEELKNQRNDYEDACLRRLSELVPPGCRVTILADRGFGDQKLFAFLGELGFDYVIRFRGNIHVSDTNGQTRPAADWVGKNGRARKLRDARVTAKGQQVGAVVCVHAKGMKEPWCLATSQKRRDGGGSDQSLRPALDYRATVPRHQGFAVRDGAILHPCRRADAS